MDFIFREFDEIIVPIQQNGFTFFNIEFNFKDKETSKILGRTIDLKMMKKYVKDNFGIEHDVVLITYDYFESSMFRTDCCFHPGEKVFESNGKTSHSYTLSKCISEGKQMILICFKTHEYSTTIISFIIEQNDINTFESVKQTINSIFPDSEPEFNPTFVD